MICERRISCARWRNGWGVLQGDEVTGNRRQVGPWIGYLAACPCEMCTTVHGELLRGAAAAELVEAAA